MTRSDQLSFEIYVMDLAEHCKTKNDYERLANELRQSIENVAWIMGLRITITERRE